jgi:hypothetical protein
MKAAADSVLTSLSKQAHSAVASGPLLMEQQQNLHATLQYWQPWGYTILHSHAAPCCMALQSAAQTSSSCLHKETAKVHTHK